MNNTDYLKTFQQTHASQIDKLFWIATSLENNDLKELLEQMDVTELFRCFPDAKKEKSIFSFGYSGKDILEYLIDFRKLGFIAEVHFPECTNFSFDKGRPVSWRSNNGKCIVKYVYAETTHELIAEIQKVGDKVFEGYIKKAKSIKK